MASRKGLDVAYGTVAFGRSDRPVGESQESILKALSLLKSHGVNKLDTAQIYGGAEAALGKSKAGTEHGFVIDTKWKGGWGFEAWATYDNIVNSAKQSLDTIGIKKADVFYMHAPDVHVPLEETLKGVDAVYRSGGFERFGLSNYNAKQVQEVLDVCKKNGYVTPKVYQGNYSAAARLCEDKLMPLLRKNGMSFFAYSPIAGGFLTKTRKFVEDGEGRFGKGEMYGTLYGGTKFLDFLDQWDQIAQEEGISKAELAYRWVNYHSALKPQFGDVVIFGASRLEQIDETCKYLEAGPLSDKSAQRINALWDTVKNDALMDNFAAADGPVG